jgi:octaprenyl-diphosphate synthase
LKTALQYVGYIRCVTYTCRVSELIKSELEWFDRRLAQELHSQVDFLKVISEELVLAGGKRLRPSLSFLTGRLLGVACETSMQVALTVELTHSASLLHDDLIDDAETRRGLESAFRRYGNVISVMSGDFMLAKVLGLLADLGHRDFTRLMSDTAARICEGEVLQFQMASRETWDFDSYRQVIEGKTAVLFAAALEGVGLFSGASVQEQSALKAFGMSYGRAFQIRDDYLDLMGDEKLMGKPVGGDLREGKGTYPVLCLLETGVDEVRSVLRRHASEDGDVSRMIELVSMYGADAATKERIGQEVGEAIAALAVFPPSEARSCLEQLAELEFARVN